jgi:vitamin K-dependent gamma-carboxylase
MATDSSSKTPHFGLALLIESPVDIASLAAFRFLFGLVMAAAMVRFLCKGWVRQLYVEPAFYFPYTGFEWIHPWPGALMHVHFIMLALLAACVALGFFYRICITLFFLGFTYVELLDQTAYLNHYYLVSLLSGIMIFLPAHRGWSMDAWLNPRSKQSTVPAWTINLLRFQIAVVYFFAGLAKVNADWLWKAQPLRIWLAARSDLPIFGSLLGQTWVAYVASWSGAIYDLTIVFFLMSQRTRKVAFLAVIAFHLGTWVLFNIGMFPWIMIAASTVFFSSDWPRLCMAHCIPQTARWLRRPSWTAWAKSWGREVPSAGAIAVAHPRLLWVLLAFYAVLQVCLPLRPYLLNKEEPAWGCHGFNMAWQVMVAEKTGYVEFYELDPLTGKRRRIRTGDYITPRQEMLMAQDPYLIQVLARRISADIKARGKNNFRIVVNAFATVNGRPSQQIVDPQADVANRSPTEWILPLRD